MRDKLAFLKKWLSAVTATLLTLFLLYVGNDYPCLTGAGLALADFEALLLFVLIAVPCLVWAVRCLWPCASTPDESTEKARLVNALAVVVVAGVALYALIAIPVIFSFARHPLQFICR